MLTPDITVAAVGVVFNIMLLPTLLNPRSRIPRVTSLTYVVGSLVQVWAFLSWGGLLTAMTAIIGCLEWFLMVLYRKM